MAQALLIIEFAFRNRFTLGKAWKMNHDHGLEACQILKSYLCHGLLLAVLARAVDASP